MDMAQLTGPQLQQIESALLNAYDETSLARMVRYELDKNLDAIAGGSNLTAVVFNLITWAERNGMTEQLIAGACNGNPTNSKLQALAVAAKEWATVAAEPTPAPVTPDPPPATAPATDGYAYDVFISYSSKDRDWVRNTLLPRLEQAGLRVAIDFRDFEFGASSMISMEEAVAQSRRTLLVLTPNWVASEWTGYESLLVQTSDPMGLRRRTIPMMRVQCDLPARIAMLTYADFIQPDDAQWDRLLQSLRPA